MASRRVPVTTIVINRAEAKNVLDSKTARGLAGALQLADADEEVRAIVLTGAGGAFCSGADLKELATDGMFFPWTGGNDSPLGMPMSKPLIGAIEGAATAEGLGVALFCDIRIVDDSASFGVFSRRWGVPLGDGTTVRLPRLVGMGRALDMVITGRAVGAEEAIAMGLATRRVARGTTRVEAEKLANQIAEYPQEAMLSDRRSIYETFDLESVAAMRRELELARAAFGQEAQDSIQRFVQRASGDIRLRKT
ncbi:MAG: enoyl-CoA hydratase/isomerase family protein [Alphaproteobacteria bacterium]|nr:enoyl-CoA hydratase/isomerase family protein [Alphaproteobacteria bacterium]